MRKLVILFILILSAFSCAQDKLPLLGETEYQREMNAKFKDALKSPLTKKDRKVFRTLDFFKFDSAYVVKAKLKLTPNETPFVMPTTTEREPLYVKYGILSFKLKDSLFSLNVYRDLELIKEEGFKDHLFLPFMDHTNGEDSYAGGRYIELKLPENDTITIDFNEAYNPYCAYNKRYSCPIVPMENYLKTYIKAGVKKYETY